MTGVAEKAFERETTPPVNLLKDYGLLKRWGDEWLVALQAQYVDRVSGETVVDFHKRVLGRQDFCWVGGSAFRRFYVWDRPLWRVFVHNVGGVGFEVPLDCEDVWVALADYVRAVEC